MCPGLQQWWLQETRKLVYIEMFIMAEGFVVGYVQPATHQYKSRTVQQVHLQIKIQTTDDFYFYS